MNISRHIALAALVAAAGLFAVGGIPRAIAPIALALPPDLPSPADGATPEAAPFGSLVPFDPAAADWFDPSPTGAIEPALPEPALPEPTRLASAPSGPRLSLLESLRFAAAAALYRKGALAAADAIAAPISDSIQRAALEWIALKTTPTPERIAAFESAHPDWPAEDYLRGWREGWLFSKHAPAKVIADAFANDPPSTSAGVLASARADLDFGRKDEAAAAVRALWRDHDLEPWAESAILKEFAGLLTRADHKYRADRLLYAEKFGPALRAAALAGPDEVALANARFEASRGPLPPRAIAAIPANLQSDPGLLFARVQDARRSDRTAEADAWLAMAPKDSAALIDPDKWWTERRMVAREWLDRGEPARAYRLCADAPTDSAPAKVDAAFHAGWIALRFLDDPQTAARHFDAAVDAAITPLAVARANYWRGRAAEAMNAADDARHFYERAAAYPIAYYGQLAARRLGRDGSFAPREPQRVASGDARAEATRIVELYYAAGYDDFATSLAYAAAATWTDEAQLAALGEVLARSASAPVNVAFGKIATERGFALDETAFPTFGLPSFAPLPHSADIASVLAVARQESEFRWRAASGAGAQGLMQIIPSTALMTARRAGVPFDYSRLVSDPVFNLQLGAAYLGQLMQDEGGSLEMTLAAYNAGAGRVAQWISMFGDPRSGAVDPVDWVERIPFDETRDYVERVSENLGIYRARLAGPPSLVAGAARLARE
jgi:soluble lytic murein transglycosylase